MSNRSVYFDHAATTPVLPEVLVGMQAYWTDKFGNPSSLHAPGMDAKMALDNARVSLGQQFGASKVVFTSGATEAINLGHKGVVENYRNTGLSGQPGKVHIITTKIEHKAVLATVGHLEKLGWADVTYLPVDKSGVVLVHELESAIRENTLLVSVMWVNNEVGSVQPIETIGQKLVRINKDRLKSGRERILFHSDITQGVGYYPFSLAGFGLDLASLTGHKLGAPKGVGALLLGEGIKLVRQSDGGDQEGGLRAGTENFASIIGLVKACEIAHDNQVKRRVKIVSVRDYMLGKIATLDEIKINGNPATTAPHIINCTVRGVEGESLVLLLSDEGVYVSTGSACTSGDLSPSHVLSAMGLGPVDAHGSIRWSLSAKTTEKDVDYALAKLSLVASKLRILRKGIK